MKTCISFATGVCLGIISAILWLALPLAGPDDNTLDILAFRAMGCEPHFDEHRALHSGCEVVKHVEARP